MKRKYIIFYMTSDGAGSTEMKVSRSEIPNNVDKIREIEKILSNGLKSHVVLTNFKFVGFSWK